MVSIDASECEIPKFSKFSKYLYNLLFPTTSLNSKETLGRKKPFYLYQFNEFFIVFFINLVTKNGIKVQYSVLKKTFFIQQHNNLHPLRTSIFVRSDPNHIRLRTIKSFFFLNALLSLVKTSLLSRLLFPLSKQEAKDLFNSKTCWSLRTLWKLVMLFLLAPATKELLQKEIWGSNSW